MRIIDTNLPRKSELVSKKLNFLKGTKIPLMSEVEISDSGTCNRKCQFCPRSDPEYPDIKEFISTSLHKKIFKELSEIDYSGLVIYSGFVEPLLNKNIYKNISEARNYLPKAAIELITNGDVLNLDRLKRLFDSGLDTILISVYDGKEQEEMFQELCVAANLKKNQYVIRNRYLPETLNFGMNFSNRSGMLENAIYRVKPLQNPLNKECFYPAYKFFIDYNGDVLICSHDWGKKNIVGNLKNQKILDVWLNKKFEFARKKLLLGKRTLEPCSRCDVDGTLIGKSSSNEWKNNYKL